MLRPIITSDGLHFIEEVLDLTTVTSRCSRVGFIDVMSKTAQGFYVFSDEEVSSILKYKVNCCVYKETTVG